MSLGKILIGRLFSKSAIIETTCSVDFKVYFFKKDIEYTLQVDKIDTLRYVYFFHR